MGPGAAALNGDVRVVTHAKVRGENAIVDVFFEYLPDPLRSLLPIPLGAPLVLAFLAALKAFSVVDTYTDVTFM